MITKSDNGTLIHSELNIDDEYLMHYGVKGMKWGQRKEVRAENKKAFELGREATIYNKMHSRAQNRTEKMLKKMKKKPNNKKLLEKASAAAASSAQLRIKRDESADAVKKHESELKSRYGAEHIKGVRYDKNGNIKERTTSPKRVAHNAAMLTAQAVGYAAGYPSIGYYRVTPSYRALEAANYRQWKKRTTVKNY